MEPGYAIDQAVGAYVRAMRSYLAETFRSEFGRDWPDKAKDALGGKGAGALKAEQEEGKAFEESLDPPDFAKLIERFPDLFPESLWPGIREGKKRQPPGRFHGRLWEIADIRNDDAHIRDLFTRDAKNCLDSCRIVLSECGLNSAADGMTTIEGQLTSQSQREPAPEAVSEEPRRTESQAPAPRVPAPPAATSGKPPRAESQTSRKTVAGLPFQLVKPLGLLLVMGIAAAVAAVYLFALRGDTADSPQQVPAIASAEPSEGIGTTTPGTSAESQRVQPAAHAEQSDDGEPTPEDNPGSSQSVQGAGDAAAPQQTQPQDADDPGNGGSPQHDNGNTSQPAQAVASEEQADSGSPPRQDGDGSDASTTTETPTNRQPECRPITDLEILEINEGTDRQVFLDDYCTDPDGDHLKFSASPSNDLVVSLDEQPDGDRGRLSIYGEGRGTATITVTATDPSSGESAEMSFAVTVLGRIDCPIIDDVWVNRGEAAQTINLNCSDPEGHSLTYSVSSNAPDVADVSISGSTLTISFGNFGRADVRYTATGSDGRSVSREFEVVVN